MQVRDGDNRRVAVSLGLPLLALDLIDGSCIHNYFAPGSNHAAEIHVTKHVTEKTLTGKI
jgi:hypothetical protein